MRPGRLGHVGALDGIRGLAVAAVVVHHLQVPAVRGGWLGVDVFFALSGFLITVSVLNIADGRLGPFLHRRFWRLAPALAVLLAWYVALAPDEDGRKWEYALASATQWINVQGAAGGPFSDRLGHLWSLAAEVQFYVVWPVLLVVLLRRSVPRPVIVGALVAAFAAGWVARAMLWDGGTPWNRLYLAPDTRSAGLVAGCIAGLLFGWGWLDRRQGARRLLAALALPALGFLVWFVADQSFLDGAVYRWSLGLAAVAAGLLVLAGATSGGGPLRPLLELRPVRWLGRVSYSVYLWHVPLIAETVRRWPDLDAAGRAVIVVPSTLVVATASWVLVEKPLLRGPRRPTRRPPEPAGVASGT
jgi:peptidoglycan/LPS O-acetylase OafA/YrhL